MQQPVSCAIELVCQTFRCAIQPGLGGCITGLWLGDTPVLRATPANALTSARQSGCFPLVPYSNRIGYGKLSLNGTDYSLRPSMGDEPHAIHGVGWQRAWRVIEARDQFASLRYEHQPDDAWPFAFESLQTFELSANELKLTLRVDNRSGVAAPFGLGWHPYFVKRLNSYLAFEATERWEMGSDKLPTHNTTSCGLATGCTSLEVDHCFDGWNGEVQLRDELLHIRLTSSLNRLVVFTNSNRAFVAIEPVSHVNDAVNLADRLGIDADALGLRVLQPGESIASEMSIQVDPVQPVLQTKQVA